MHADLHIVVYSHSIKQKCSVFAISPLFYSWFLLVISRIRLALLRENSSQTQLFSFTISWVLRLGSEKGLICYVICENPLSPMCRTSIYPMLFSKTPLWQRSICWYWLFVCHSLQNSNRHRRSSIHLSYCSRINSQRLRGELVSIWWNGFPSLDGQARLLSVLLTHIALVQPRHKHASRATEPLTLACTMESDTVLSGFCWC